jgi:WD40 repeat protein
MGLVAADRAGVVKLWDGTNGRLLKTICNSAGPIDGLAFSPDGRSMVGCGLNGAIQCWETAGWHRIWRRQYTSRAIRTCVFSPDGRLIAAGGDEGTIRILAATDGRPVRMLDPGAGPVFAALFISPREVASAGVDGVVRISDWPSGAELQWLDCRTNHILALSLSPDRRMLATAGMDGTTRLWEASTGQPLRALRNGQPASVLSFSPNGALLGVGTTRGEIQLWQSETGRQIRQISGHSSLLTGLSFSPDGRFLATSAEDNKTALWMVQPDRHEWGDLETQRPIRPAWRPES